MASPATPLIKIQPTDALYLVDVQLTFMPGGGLPVVGGNEVVPIIQDLLAKFEAMGRYASLDQHDLGHISLASSYVGFKPFDLLTLERVLRDPPALAAHAKFTTEQLTAYLHQCHGKQQLLWPDHALTGTVEQRMHPKLERVTFLHVQTKGTRWDCDSYSPFTDNVGRSTGLANWLRAAGVTRLFLCGLAFDVCVRYAALDAAKLGFETFVIKDACRSVTPQGEDETERAFMQSDVTLITSDQLVAA